MMRLTLLLSLVARGAAWGATCLDCVRSGRTWHGEVCVNGTHGSSSSSANLIRHTTEEQCVTHGCRGPLDTYSPLPIASLSISCSTCCEEHETSCTVESWTPLDDDSVAPFYNTANSSDGECAVTCAPCAVCSQHDEDVLLALRPHGDHASSCTVPHCLATDEIDATACMFHPASCACFCERVRVGLAQCPHLAHQIVDGSHIPSDADLQKLQLGPNATLHPTPTPRTRPPTPRPTALPRSHAEAAAALNVGEQLAIAVCAAVVALALMYFAARAHRAAHARTYMRHNTVGNDEWDPMQATPAFLDGDAQEVQLTTQKSSTADV